MTDNREAEVYRAHREGQIRYVYFLLAAAGAAIALAINQTEGLALQASQALLGVSVLAWGLSFYCGCRHLAYVNSILYSNVELLRVQSGSHPKAGRNPEVIAAASDGIRAAMEDNSDRANRYGHWQFRLLVTGACFYIAWHVFEMYQKAAAVA